jgi:hypothetical protein
MAFTETTQSKSAFVNSQQNSTLTRSGWFRTMPFLVIHKLTEHFVPSKGVRIVGVFIGASFNVTHFLALIIGRPGCAIIVVGFLHVHNREFSLCPLY